MNHYEFILEQVYAAGEKLRETRGSVLEIMQKGDDPRDEITVADSSINMQLIDAIKNTFPGHRIESEEGGEGASEGAYLWTIDPIDGTSNFARDIPHFATCLSLLKDDKPIAGALYNPVTDECFSFLDNEAFFNGAQVHVSTVDSLSKAQVLFHIGRKQDLFDWGTTVMRSLLSGVKKVKDLGSSGLDLAFVAAGRVDAVIYGTLTTRDVAAAIGMVRAAGGEVYNVETGEPVMLNSVPQTIVATANQELFTQLQPLLARELLSR